MLSRNAAIANLAPLQATGLELPVSNERELASLAGALLRRNAAVSDPEIELLGSISPVHPRILQTAKGLILAGSDPLGESYCALRTREERRSAGSIYTPKQIVKCMIECAAAGVQPKRIVDPGCGSGRFVAAAAKKFKTASLLAIDNDPLAVLILRANAAVLGFSHRLTALCTDFREIDLPSIDGPTLFIGNPPFVRHHGIDPYWKTWFARTAAEFGYRASKLSGLHIHFFLKIRELSKCGDFGVIITSAEWLDVNYGTLVREMLADGMGGNALHIISPESKPFPDVITTGAIACFKVGSRPTHLVVRHFASSDDLDKPSEEKLVPWTAAKRATRWSSLAEIRNSATEEMVELGDLCRVHRGQVTGANSVWIANQFEATLPDRILFPAITSARELIRAAPLLASSNHLRRVVDLPIALDSFDESERLRIERFLQWAKEQGADRTYVARHRAVWWSVGLRAPAPILCTYMARQAPVFVRNIAGARHINIAHGLYPRLPLSEPILVNLVRWLNSNILRSQGRTYSGGLTKFEPRELERLRVPEPNRLLNEFCHREPAEHAEHATYLG